MPELVCRMICLAQCEQEVAARFDDCLECVTDKAREDLGPLRPGVMHHTFASKRGSLLGLLFFVPGVNLELFLGAGHCGD
jgi:hypothetical protein